MVLSRYKTFYIRALCDFESHGVVGAMVVREPFSDKCPGFGEEGWWLLQERCAAFGVTQPQLHERRTELPYPICSFQNRKIDASGLTVVIEASRDRRRVAGSVD